MAAINGQTSQMAPMSQMQGMQGTQQMAPEMFPGMNGYQTGGANQRKQPFFF